MGTETTSGTSTVPVAPTWKYQADRTIAQQAADLAGAGYVGYSGDRIADLTADQYNAQDLARSAASGTAIDPRITQASYTYGMSGFDPNEVNRYMSPFTSGVVNEIGRLGNKQLFQSVIPGVNTTFSGAGQFGSTRNAGFLNQAIQDQNYNTLGQQAKALQDAHQAGLNAYTQWHQNALSNANTMTNAQITGANLLNTVGQQNYDQNQKSMDLSYQDFVNQRDYAQKALGWMKDINTAGTSTAGQASLYYDSSQAASPLTQAMKTAGQIYGLFPSSTNP